MLRVPSDTRSAAGYEDIRRSDRVCMSVPCTGNPVWLHKREPIQCKAETKAKSSSVSSNRATMASDGLQCRFHSYRTLPASGIAEVQSIAATPRFPCQILRLQKRNCARCGSEAAHRGRLKCALVVSRTAAGRCRKAG